MSDPFEWFVGIVISLALLGLVGTLGFAVYEAATHPQTTTITITN